jgi:hypothetical protein
MNRSEITPGLLETNRRKILTDYSPAGCLEIVDINLNRIKESMSETIIDGPGIAPTTLLFQCLGRNRVICYECKLLTGPGDWQRFEILA